MSTANRMSFTCGSRGYGKPQSWGATQFCVWRELVRLWPHPSASPWPREALLCDKVHTALGKIWETPGGLSQRWWPFWEMLAVQGRDYSILSCRGYFTEMWLPLTPASCDLPVTFCFSHFVYSDLSPAVSGCALNAIPKCGLHRKGPWDL